MELSSQHGNGSWGIPTYNELSASVCSLEHREHCRSSSKWKASTGLPWWCMSQASCGTRSSFNRDLHHRDNPCFSLRPRCFGYQQRGEEYCQHCYSDEHFRAGWRRYQGHSGIVREAPLNGEWLPRGTESSWAGQNVPGEIGQDKGKIWVYAHNQEFYKHTHAKLSLTKGKMLRQRSSLPDCAWIGWE